MDVFCILLVKSHFVKGSFVLTLQSRETKMTVKLFRYEGWPEGAKVPTSTKSLTSLISQVSRSSRDSSTEPIIVHCM